MKEHEPRHIEESTAREIFVLKKRAITISGRSGTGKTVTMDRLGDKYGIKRKIKTGDLMRRLTNTGNTSRGVIQREESVDQAMDNEQRDILKSASLDDQVILEGRLAGVIAAGDPDILKVLFVAPSETRMRRILSRALEDKTDAKFNLQREVEKALKSNADPAVVSYLYDRINEEENEVLNLKTVKKKEKDRELWDLARWREQHSELVGIDPFNPVNRNHQGQLIYDLIVNTGKLTIDQTVLLITEKLIDKSIVEKGIAESLSKKAVIFQSNNSS
jgi:cytidylate kinase